MSKSIEVLDRKDELHRRFDLLWVSQKHRTRLYRQLAGHMGVKNRHAHFAYINTIPALNLAEQGITRLERAHELKVQRRLAHKLHNSKKPKTPKLKEMLNSVEMAEAFKRLEDINIKKSYPHSWLHRWLHNAIVYISKRGRELL